MAAGVYGGEEMKTGARKYLDIAWDHLAAASVASCTCDVKTDVGAYHKENCRYRLISAAMDALNILLEGTK